MRILVVEDDEAIAELVKTVLTEQRYTVDIATDGEAGWQFAEGLDYDLMLLDVMLPKLDGLSFCRRLRSQGSQVPVLLLTAKNTSFDKVAGLDAGADDYIIKPLDCQELSARIRALLRRGQGSATPVLEWGDLHLNPQSCEVTYGANLLHLTPKEYALLELLLRNGQRVFSRSAILDKLWAFDSEPPGEDTVKTHVKGLRQKLKAAGAADLLETVYGLGYRLNQGYLKARPPAPATARRQPEQAQAAIANIWDRAKDKILQRIRILDQLTAAVLTNSLQPDQWQEAKQEAHKLAGALGTFGLHTGTHIARQIEELLEQHSRLNQQQQQDLQSLVRDLQQTVEHREQSGLAKSALAEVNLELTSHHSHQRQVLVLGNNSDLRELLAAESCHWGLRVAIATDLTTVPHQIEQIQPDLILLDLPLAELTEELLTLLTQLGQRTPPLPVLVLVETHQLSDRLTASEWKWNFLQKPVTSAQVFAALTQILQKTEPTTFTILAVDDDPLILMTLQAVLEPWGIKVFTLQHPAQFWHRLPDVRPDLIMLDVEMPDVSGIQLCQTLRDDTHWNWLPVLFLTAKTDASTIAQVFTVGADDYINKPIVAPELVARVLNRLERWRSLQNHFEGHHGNQLDAPLRGTTTPHRQQFTQEANRFLKLARRFQQPLSLAVLDMAQPPPGQPNPELPPAKFIPEVNRLIRQKLHDEDLLVHWEGSRWVAGLYGMTRRASVEWLAAVLEALRTVQVNGEHGEPLRVTMNGGVAQYPDDGATLQLLYESAATLLTHALPNMGRILPVGWMPPSPDACQTEVLLVHPDSPFATAVTQALETRGYHYRWLQNGKTALAALAGTAPTLRATIVILSGDLPDLEVTTFLKRWKKHKLARSSRLILLLPPATTQIDHLLELGAFDYITTPCSPNVLLQSVYRALEFPPT